MCKDVNYFESELQGLTEEVVIAVLDIPEAERTAALGLSVMCHYVSASDKLWEEYAHEGKPDTEISELFDKYQADMYVWLKSKGMTGDEYA